MITDAVNFFSGGPLATAAGQSLTGTSEVGSESTVNTLSINHQSGHPIEVWVLVTAVGGTCSSFTVKLQSDDNQSCSSPTTLATWTPSATATGLYRLGIAPGLIPAGEKYLRLTYTMAGTSPTKTVFGGISPWVQSA